MSTTPDTDLVRARYGEGGGYGGKTSFHSSYQTNPTTAAEIIDLRTARAAR